MNFWAVVSFAYAIYGAVSASLAMLGAGQAFTVPGIRTYLDGKHVEVDITVKPLP